ncbi:MAG: ribonuclease III [Pseudomonadota bacterium]
MLTDFSARLGHDFKAPDLLRRALTHSSAVSATNQGDYERLEFLGDRVLGLVIADLLYHRFPKEPEGSLAKRFAGVVCRDALAEIAREIDLGSQLIIAKAEEEAGERDNPALLSNACEAVIAALYLDGGIAVAKEFIERYWIRLIEADRKPPRDPKTSLQEWSQGRGLSVPKYQILSREGPDHNPIFTVSVTLPKLPPMIGTGSSKRAAEQAAAEKLLFEVERN